MAAGVGRVEVLEERVVSWASWVLLVWIAWRGKWWGEVGNTSDFETVAANCRRAAGEEVVERERIARGAMREDMFEGVRGC